MPAVDLDGGELAGDQRTDSTRCAHARHRMQGLRVASIRSGGPGRHRGGRRGMHEAAAGGGSAGAGGTIKVGVYGPLTGGSSPMGLSMRDGVRLAAKEIDAHGGVL